MVTHSMHERVLHTFSKCTYGKKKSCSSTSENFRRKFPDRPVPCRSNIKFGYMPEELEEKIRTEIRSNAEELIHVNDNFSQQCELWSHEMNNTSSNYCEEGEDQMLLLM